MALNYSQRPIFPSHTSENMVSPMRIVNGYVEGVSEKKAECFSRSWHSSQGEADEWNFNCGRDKIDQCTSQDLTSKDIVDLLPSDPFGMDIKTTFTAITGWLEDLDVDYAERMRSNSGRDGQEDYGLFAGWNFIWNSSLKFQSFPSYVHFAEKLNISTHSFPSNLQVYVKPNLGTESFSNNVQLDEKLNVEAGECQEVDNAEGPSAPYDFGFQSAGNMKEIVGFGSGSASCSSELQVVGKMHGASSSEGGPHEALSFALGYLGVQDLFSVERVCRSLCSTVRGDPLLWMNIHIDQPLNEKLTDDVLVQLASRAQNNLQCLSLVECPKVTDDGIRRILENNSRITKLCVPGCTRLTIEGIMNNVKMYNSNAGGIKHLRIGGLYGVTHDNYEELKLLLGADRHKLESQHKPHFYHRGNFYLPYDDDRVMDIEMCPLCEKFRLVYDCPAESCQKKDKASVACRACTLCIPRCAQCGRCVNDTEYEETFCLDLLCSECFKQLLKVQFKLDKRGDDPCGALHEPSCSFSQLG